MELKLKDEIIEIRSARDDEFKDATNLINEVFRTSRGEKPTMVEEFPFLLNKNNLENMIVGVQDKKIVTDINYLIQDVNIEGNLIKVASIGAVCTHPNYEGRGYASKILDFVEDKMLKDGVDLISISGTRSLYSRRNCSRIKSFYKYTVCKENEFIKLIDDHDIKVDEFKKEDLDKYIELYNENSTRFLRSREQFSSLLYSATIPWGNFSYKKLSIKKDNKVIGYLVLRIIESESKFGKVIEMILDKRYVAAVLSKVAKEYDLNHINYYVHIKDDLNQFEGYSKKELDYQGGTLKVINFEKLMNSLKPYFKKYIDNELLEELKFKESEGKYIIEYKDKEQLVFDDVNMLNKFLFEYNENEYKEINKFINIQLFAKRVLPIEFVWTENLNYQ